VFPVVFPATQWQGKLERIVPAPATVGAKTCTLVAFGTLGYLNQFETQLASSTNRRTDLAIGDILDDLGWTEAGDRDLDTGITTIPRFWTSRTKGIDAMRLVEEAEAGFIKETKTGQIAFESRYHRLTETASTDIQMTFSDSPVMIGTTYSYVALAQTDPLTTIINHVEASARTYNTASIATLWTHPETGSDSPTLAPGEAKTFEAEFPNPDSANNAEEVDVWTVPTVAGSDVAVWTASNGSGTDITAAGDIGISAVRTAERMAITLTNNSSLAGYVTTLRARGTAVSTKNPVIVRAIDTDSPGIYGERKYVARTKFIPTASEAQDWCDYHLSVYGSPVEIMTLTIATSSPEIIGHVLMRDLSDRIRIIANSATALGVSGSFFLENERHHVRNGGTEHTTTWQLSPASGGYSQFWVLGTSILSFETVPAF